MSDTPEVPALIRAGSPAFVVEFIEDLQRDNAHLRAQIDPLAHVLLTEFGGPTQDESACELAVRLLREMRTALEASVKHQSHYASLLNMHDGGARIGFPNADAWIARLRQTGTLP